MTEPSKYGITEPVEPGTSQRERGTSRRAFLRTAAATAGAAALGTNAVGTTAARGIETPWIERAGNQIVDPSGNEVVLRGVNVTDPARANNTFYRRPVPETVEHATDPERDWYARVIRIPCQPGDIAGANVGEPDPPAFDESDLTAYVDTHLDPVVQKCAEVGVYCIVDYHRHRTNDYASDAMDDELQLFWSTIASEYAEDSHVLFEVYNEPIDPYPGHGRQDLSVTVKEKRAKEEGWDVWKEAAQPWVDTIRENAPRNVVLIGSPRWSQYTYWAPENEFDGDNLAYVGHVYTHENLRPLGEYFGQPAEEVPVFVSEFGYQNEKKDGSEPPPYIAGTTSGAGEEFRSFFEEYDSVHWQAWCFDPFWEPIMFGFDDATHEWSLLGGETWAGEFIRDYLKAKRNDDVPGGGSGDTTAPFPPIGLEQVDATRTSVTVTWEPTTDEGPAGLAEYVVSVAEGPSVTVPAGTTTATVEGLSADTDYEVAIRAVDGAGNRSTPTVATVQTGTDRTPAPVDGTAPRDNDDDGLYEDLNGNGTTDYDDVVRFFGGMDGDAMRGDAWAYDFNGNDEVDFDDLVALFGRIP